MQLPRRSIPQISGLIAFESTARHLSFSRAAVDLALSQGAVSKRVRQLEDQLGVLLVSRGGHQVQLTRFGRMFLPRVQSILAQIDCTTRDLLQEAGRVRSVTVQADPGFAIGWLLPRLREFARSSPGVQVNVRSNGPSQPAEADADIVVRLARPEAAAGDERLLFHDAMVAVVSRPAGARISDAELLATWPLLRFAGAPECWDRHFSATRRPDGMVPGPVYDHHALLVAAVRGGGGIALLPRLLVQDDLRSGRLRQLGAERPMEDGYLMALNPASQGIAEVERFGDWLSRAATGVAELRRVSGGGEAKADWPPRERSEGFGPVSARAG